MLQRDLVQNRVYGCRFRVIGPAFIPRLYIPNHLLLLCLCLCVGGALRTCFLGEIIPTGLRKAIEAVLTFPLLREL